MASPTIDLVVLSHGDADHINLMYYLLSKFPKEEHKLTIKNVYYGGDWTEYEKSAELFIKHSIVIEENNKNILVYIRNYYFYFVRLQASV